MNNVHHQILENGIEVFVFDYPFMKTTEITAYINAGRNFEKDNEAGIFHLLEHLTLSRTKNYPDRYQMKNAIKDIGGYINGYTGLDIVYYPIKVIDEYFEESIKFLFEITNNVILDEKDIQFEKDAITEELNGYINNPQRYFSGDLLPLVGINNPRFSHHSKRDLEVLESTTLEDLEKVYDKYFNSKNIVITVATSKKHNEVIEKIEKVFNKQRTGSKQTQVTETVVRPATISEDTKTNQLSIGFALTTGGRIQGKEKNSMLSGIMQLMLYERLREKQGLVYGVFVSATPSNIDGLLMCYTFSKPSNKDLIEKEFKAMLNDLKIDIDNKLFEKAKTQYITSLLFNEELPQRETHRIISDYIATGTLCTSNDQIKIIEKITKGDIIKLANQYFTEENIGWAYLTPEK